MWGRNYYYLNFTDEETEAWEGKYLVYRHSKLWNRDFFPNTTKFGIWKQDDKNRKEWRKTEDSEKKLGRTAFIKKIYIYNKNQLCSLAEAFI